jgi:hypothetical protein
LSCLKIFYWQQQQQQQELTLTAKNVARAMAGHDEGFTQGDRTELHSRRQTYIEAIAQKNVMQ